MSWVEAVFAGVSAGSRSAGLRPGLPTKGKCLKATKRRLSELAAEPPSRTRKTEARWLLARCTRCGKCPSMRAPQII